MASNVSFTFVLPRENVVPGSTFLVQYQNDYTADDFLQEVGAQLSIRGKMYDVGVEYRADDLRVSWPPGAQFPLTLGRYTLHLTLAPIGSGGGGGPTEVAWGGITGDILDQADLVGVFQAQTDATNANTSRIQAAETDIAGKVDSVVAGTGISVDETDPNNPVVSTSA